MTKKLRIFINSLQIGGTERHLAQVLPMLAQKYGWKIKVILSSNNMDLAPQLLSSEITVLTPPKLDLLNKFPKFLEKFFRIIINLCRFCKEFIQGRHTITHFFLSESYMVGMLAAIITFLPAKKIMSRRSLNDYRHRRAMLWFLELKIHRFTDFFLGNSQAIVDQLCKEEDIPSQKVKLIYNGTDIKPYLQKSNYEDIRIKLNIPANAWVMIMVANLMPYKGHEDLLDALALAKPLLKDKPWYMIFIGNDSRGIQKPLQKKAQLLDINPHILWLNGISEVVPYLKAANIGILSPDGNEGFSNAVVEGMLAKLPMIVTDVGGNKEAIINEQNGLVVPPKSPQKLADAIVYLYNNHEITKQMGVRGQQRAIENFSLERCVAQYNEFYESINGGQV